MSTYVYSFISHAHADNALCDPYIVALTSLGAPHYYDRENPQVGKLVPYLLQDEIRKAQTMVVMVTPASQASQWVRLEIAMFHHIMSSEPGRKLVWVRLVDCVVEPLLAAHLGIDAVNRPFDQVMADLARALEERVDNSHAVDLHRDIGDHATITDHVASGTEEQARQIVAFQEKIGGLAPDTNERLRIVATNLARVGPYEAYTWVDPDSFGREVEANLSRSAETFNFIRNLLLLTSIALALIESAMVARGYMLDIASRPIDINYPFLALWQSGFGSPDGFVAFTPSQMGTIYFFLVTVIIGVTWRSQAIKRRAHVVAQKLTQELRALMQSLVELSARRDVAR